jgi:hypothetical protein
VECKTGFLPGIIQFFSFYHQKDFFLSLSHFCILPFLLADVGALVPSFITPKPEPVYKTDAFLRGKGHDVLRRPSYHCEFNPIEMVWEGGCQGLCWTGK